jgi:hypothetical protein
MVSYGNRAGTIGSKAEPGWYKLIVVSLVLNGYVTDLFKLCYAGATCGYGGG